MTVIFSTDNNFVPHAMTMIQSVMKNSRVSDLRFHLIYTDLTEKNLLKMNSFFQSKSVIFYTHFISAEKTQGFRWCKEITLTTYLRIFAPELVLDDWAIYLDCDMIVIQDLNRVFDGLSDKYPVYAVEDCMGVKNRFGITKEMPYFNAGCLVMNLKLWRQRELTKTMLNFISENSADLIHHDQDALNAVLKGEIGVLHPRWNLFYAIEDERNITRHICYTAEELKDAIESPAIIHFAWSIQKPWKYSTEHPYKKLYWTYRNETPWWSFIPEDISFRNVCRKCIPISLRCKIRNWLLGFKILNK